MLGAVFLGNRKVEIRKFPDPTPGPGEVVIEMKASGMCGSDLKFYRSAPGEAQKSLGFSADAEPFIGGHEPCGVVAARGPGVSEREAPIGQRVMDHHYSGCGVCKHCRVGWSQLCKAGHHGLRRHRARRPCAVPQGAGAHAGAAARGAFLRRGRRGVLRHRHRLRRAAAHAPRRRLDARGVRPGTGRRQRHVLGAKMGARVIAVEKNAERRALAKKFGAAFALESEKRRSAKITKGEGVDLALDTTGVAGRAARRGALGQDLGHGVLRRRGRRRHPRRQPRHAAQAAHHHRLVDLQRHGTARVRALRRRQRHRRRRAVLAPLEARAGATRPTACSTRNRPARASSFSNKEEANETDSSVSRLHWRFFP